MNEYEFKEEKFDDGLILELVPLLEKHYQEISHFKDIKLNPDYDTYKKIHASGLMKMFTARVKNELGLKGELVGYGCYFIKNNIHYKDSLQAHQDVLYIDKTKRGFGRQFIKWCDDELRKIGIQVVYHHTKAAQSFGRILERMDYELVDLIYAKRLDR